MSDDGFLSGDVLFACLVASVLTATGAFLFGARPTLIILLATLVVALAVLGAAGIYAFYRRHRSWPLPLLLFTIPRSAVDFAFTGVPWHQRDYAVRAWRRYGSAVLGATQVHTDEWLALVQKTWKGNRYPSGVDF